MMQRLWLVAGVLCLASSIAEAQVYKCSDGKGGTVYRDAPCHEGQAPMIVSPLSPTQKLYAGIAQRVEQIRRQTVPPDAHAQIDRYLAQTLRDPESRNVDYSKQSYGSAVCGTVNAKNQFGGYTGRQAFLAVFGATGSLESVDIFTAADLRALKFTGDVATHVLPRCGIAL